MLTLNVYVWSDILADGVYWVDFGRFVGTNNVSNRMAKETWNNGMV
jgi:hypothetical protein